jgi:hypothetical protein
MKFLLKVAILAAAAKFVLHTPTSSPTRSIERVKEVRLQDIGHHVDTVFARIEATLRLMLS